MKTYLPLVIQNAFGFHDDVRFNRWPASEATTVAASEHRPGSETNCRRLFGSSLKSVL